MASCQGHSVRMGSEAWLSSSVGNTGHPPVPLDNLPDGTGTTLKSHRAASLQAVATPILPGRLPGGAGKLPALPALTANESRVNENDASEHRGAGSGAAVHLALDGRYRGCFQLGNVLRPDAESMLRGLARTHGIALLSGDNDRERERFQAIFGGRAQLRFNQSPLHKLEFIEDLQQSGNTVMMVGDGLNDAGALRRSDVGVAVVENIGTFSPASDVILEGRRVPEISNLLRFASRTVNVVWAGIVISLLYNVVGLAFAATGHLSPVICAILMPLSSISVVAFACGAVNWAARRAGFQENSQHERTQP